MATQLYCVALAVWIVSVQAAPVDQGKGQAYFGTSASTKEQQEDYLRRYYGFSPRPEDQGMSPTALTDHESAFKEAVKRLQRMANLPESGVVDEETRKVMELPRCGVSDVNLDDSSSQEERYVAQGSKWKRHDLTYTFQNFSPDMLQVDQEKETTRALNVWSEHTPLSFKRADNENADIKILFTEYDHGDKKAFDGPGGKLAHAFFPKFGGDVHMDDSETFTSYSSSGVNLFQVMAHELGHSLGLKHSDVQSALMAPFYRGYVPNLELDQDDITGIQSIYGKKSTVPASTSPAPHSSQPTGSSSSTTSESTTRSSTLITPTPTMSTSRPTSPDLCSDGQFDAITKHNGYTFAFRGSEFVRLYHFGVEPGFPRKIADRWRLIPNDLDAALHVNKLRERITYFFKGSQVWRFGPSGPITGYPKSIGSEFPGLPNNIDAAFVQGRNQQMYVTKGSLFYRVTPGSGVDAGFPKPLSMWIGLPNKIDAAFQWTYGITYFFSGPYFYRYNEHRQAVDPGFPRMIKDWWLGCPGNLNADIIAANSTNMN